MSNKLKLEVYENHAAVDKNLDIIPDGLPKPPMRLILVGQSGSGKTTLIKNFLFNTNYGYNQYFDKVYYYIGSLDDLVILKRLKDEHHMRHLALKQDFDSEEVESTHRQIERAEQKAARNGEPPATTLFIFDDQLFNGLTKPVSLTAVDSLFYRGRHSYISTIISTQQYSKLNRNTRMVNSTHIILFFGSPATEIDAISKDHCGSQDWRTTAAIIKSHLREKYDFIVIDRAAGKMLDKDWHEVRVGGAAGVSASDPELGEPPAD